jgi:hypothetical protein
VHADEYKSLLDEFLYNDPNQDDVKESQKSPSKEFLLSSLAEFIKGNDEGNNNNDINFD